MKILLFDIDGTLIDSDGAGKRSLEHAFKEVCNIDSAMDSVPLAGKTDPLIIREGLARKNIQASADLLRDLKESYIKHLKHEIITADKKLKPGVAELLNALASCASCDSNHLGLLTGNIDEGARIKLESLGIYKFFTFGAYGSDNEDRDRLLPYAQSRYESNTGCTARGEEFVVIGDTPLDVACAKPHGAMSIAVATGCHSEDELRSAGADVVLADLSDTAGFMELVS